MQWLLSLATACCLLCMGLAPAGVAASIDTLWPKPQSVQSGSQELQLREGQFSFVTSTEPHCAAFNKKQDGTAYQRYENWIFWFGRGEKKESEKKGTPDVYSQLLMDARHASRASANKKKKLMQLNSCRVCNRGSSSAANGIEDFDTIDESYSIEVDVNKTTGEAYCYIEAGSFAGVVHAMETFSQLVEVDDNGQSGEHENVDYVVTGVPLQISDAPRWGWRGILIDSARHFLSMDTLYSIVDAMATVKLNILHWHIVDAQSFPFQVGTYTHAPCCTIPYVYCVCILSTSYCTLHCSLLAFTTVCSRRRSLSWLLQVPTIGQHSTRLPTFWACRSTP
jgi:hypothetical protein